MTQLTNPRIAWFNGQFMPENSRVVKEGLRAFERMQIGPANSDCQHARQHLPRSGRTRVFALGQRELTGSVQYGGFHLRTW